MNEHYLERNPSFPQQSNPAADHALQSRPPPQPVAGGEETYTLASCSRALLHVICNITSAARTCLLCSCSAFENPALLARPRLSKAFALPECKLKASQSLPHNQAVINNPCMLCWALQQAFEHLQPLGPGADFRQPSQLRTQMRFVRGQRGANAESDSADV